APMKRNSTILGVGVAPTGAAVEASVWATPASGKCSDVEVGLIGCFAGEDPEEALTAAEAPDAQGWCEYRGVCPAGQRATCMAVSTLHTDSTTTLIGDAVLVAAAANARIIASQSRVSARLKA